MKTTAKQRSLFGTIVDHIQSGNHQKASPIIEKLTNKMGEYLKIVMGADELDAQECVQQAFLNVYEQIQAGNINNKKYLYTYMIKTCRHEYLKLINHGKKFTPEISPDAYFSEPADQVAKLANKERVDVLKACLEELDEESRDFILYFINHPDTTTREASKIFNLSEANVRTKKSRITRELHKSFKRIVTFQRKEQYTTWYRPERARFAMVS